MDTVPPAEFFGIFDRFADDISIKGCVTPQDVEDRIRARIRSYERARENAKRDRTKRWIRSRINILRNLLRPSKKGWRDPYGVFHKRSEGQTPMNFPERVIYEASLRPKSIMNLTLKYGHRRAQQIKAAEYRRRLRRVMPYKVATPLWKAAVVEKKTKK